VNSNHSVHVRDSSALAKNTLADLQIFETEQALLFLYLVLQVAPPVFLPPTGRIDA
jgi:hypothetical protein